MKTFLILGAGAGGTMVANKMAKLLDPLEWHIIIVDPDPRHYYQPGFLFIPFGIYSPTEVMKPKCSFLPQGVEFIVSETEIIEPDKSQLTLVKGNRVIHYDYLVIATGAHIHPEEIEGLLDGGWRETIHDFYTPDGAAALASALRFWKGGRLVMHIAEMPIKCPVAPLEFLFLADWHFSQRKMRDDVELVFVTPLPGAFTKPKASAALSDMLQKKKIVTETDFAIMEVDSSRKVIRSYDEREISYDLLVTVPTNMGADIIGKSGMGDDLNFVPTNKHTLQSQKWENVWVIGDASNVPTSKAGSVAHFMHETLVDNILRHMQGLPPLETFDGHSNCFIESGFNQGVLIDFNYDVEPLPGKYPMPGVGPFSLLKETPMNHWGKMGFRWMYWNLLLKGEELPLESKMSMAGKWE